MFDRMRSIHFLRPAMAGALALAITAGAPTLASADEFGARGACSRAATWSLHATRQDGKIFVTYQVRSLAAGEVWGIRLRHDGVLFFSDRRITGDDGSFSVTRRVRNRKGPDLIRARSHQLATDQVCVGGLVALGAAA